MNFQKINDNLDKKLFDIVHNKIPNNKINKSKAKKIINLTYQINFIEERHNNFLKAALLDPNNGDALLQLGLIEITNPNKKTTT